MSAEQQQKVQQSPSKVSKQGVQTASSSIEYDWIDVVRQQNSRLVQNQERQKQQEQTRKQKYREILEQEINEREIQKHAVKESKRMEHDEIEKNISIVDKYDQEKKIQKKLVERQIQEQNKQLVQEKKEIEKETKIRQTELTQNSYTINNLSVQRQNEEEVQSKILRQREFLNQLENQKRQNQDLRDLQKSSIAQEEQSHLNRLSIEEHQRKQERDKIRNDYQTEKLNVFQQIDTAYREKEQKQQDFENNYINQGLQQQLLKEKKMKELIQQGRKQLQSQVDQIVGDQLEQKKQNRMDQHQNRNKEKDQADQDFIHYKNAEKERKLNERELYQRQNFINDQQQFLRGQIKERQRHLNDNEVKINLNILPESPVNVPSSSRAMQSYGKYTNGYHDQAKGNHIYSGDYVQYDRQKQLQQVDIDLIEKMPIQNEQYKRTILNRSSASIPTFKETKQFSNIPQNSLEQSQNQHFNNSGRKNNYDLYLQQTKFPRHNAFTNNSPPQIIPTSPQYNDDFRSSQQNNSYKLPQNNSQQPPYQQSPLIQDQQNKNFGQKVLNPNIQVSQSQENIYQQNQANIQSQSKLIQPLSGISNAINVDHPSNSQIMNQQQQQQQHKRNSQSQIQQISNKNYQYDSNPNVGNNQTKQIMSPNNFYDKFSYNVQNNPNTQNLNTFEPQQPPYKHIMQVPINNNGNSNGINNDNQNQRKGSNKEFNIKSFQYNNDGNQVPNSSINKIPADNLIRVYRSPQNIQGTNGQQSYHIPQIHRNVSNQNIYGAGGTMNGGSSYSNYNNANGSKTGYRTGMSSSMNFIESRSNILSSQKQDYQQIREKNANWAQRGFNIITGS